VKTPAAAAAAAVAAAAAAAAEQHSVDWQLEQLTKMLSSTACCYIQ
jgi:hypothetical protein